MKTEFIPATAARCIGNGVYFRPIKSWHSGTYAGERLHKIPGSDDGSGCLYPGTSKIDPRFDLCSAPLSVTHRLYWHKDNPENTVSAFLSYPDGLGAVEEYFWEAYIDGDTPRFVGDDAETKMEAVIVEWFLKGKADGK